MKASVRADTVLSPFRVEFFSSFQTRRLLHSPLNATQEILTDDFLRRGCVVVAVSDFLVVEGSNI